MPTTIQVSERTKRELLKFASELQARLGRRVSFDEAIMTLLEERRRVKLARERLRSMRGILKGKREAVESLIRELRVQEEERLERLQKSAREAVD